MTNISICPKCGGKIIQPDRGQPFPSGRLPRGATGRPTYDGCTCNNKTWDDRIREGD